ncbi:MAG TPA: phosphatidate cytidylyltransferase [Bacteroidia bacterium]|nr:phosphatidate cytidylyltransferase [Bacteroidia bacterium]
MKNLFLILVLACSQLIAGCSVVGGIFKAGMIWGILLVVLIVGGIIALIMRGGKK